MRRLSAGQYRHTLTDWFGDALVTPSSLEPDLRSKGLSAIGASVNGLSSLGVERYVKGAANVAAQLVDYAPIRAELIECTVLDDQACLSLLVDTWGPRLWRRPLDEKERERLIALGQNASATLGSVERDPLRLTAIWPHLAYLRPRGR